MEKITKPLRVGRQIARGIWGNVCPLIGHREPLRPLQDRRGWCTRCGRVVPMGID